MSEMNRVYVNAITHELYIDKGTQTTVIKLPKDIDTAELAEILQSKTVVALIDAIVKGSDRHGRGA